MLRIQIYLFIFNLYCLTIIHAKRRATVQSQHNLGDFCMPGTCASLNSNCKRIGGNAFRCVCKDQYMAMNKTHCVRVINASVDETCATCIQRNGICLDENADDQMDKCFCPLDNELCQERSTSTSSSPLAHIIPVTQPFRKNIVPLTPLIVNRISQQGDLILGLYNVNQQRLINNGDSVFIGDRLFIEIKYQTDDYDSDRRQIIVENCSISSSVSDNDLKLEKASLLTDRCPSLDSRLAIRFQRLDPYHLKSSIFQINKFQTTSIVYLRCSIGICSGQIENCQERLCPDISRSINRKSSTSHSFDDYDQQRRFSRILNHLSHSFDSPNNHDYELRQVQQQFSIEIPLPQPSNKHKAPYNALFGHTSLSAQGAVERSTIIAAISIIFIIGISIALFIIYRTCYTENLQRIYGTSSFGAMANSSESIYGGARNLSQICRYDMGRRSGQRFDESFFVSNVEPLGAYRRQY